MVRFWSENVDSDHSHGKDDGGDGGQFGQRGLHAAGLALAEEGLRAAGDGAGQPLPRALLQQDHRDEDDAANGQNNRNDQLSG